MEAAQGFTAKPLGAFGVGEFLAVGLSGACRILSCIPGFYPLGDSSPFPPPLWQREMSPGIARCPGGPVVHS